MFDSYLRNHHVFIHLCMQCEKNVKNFLHFWFIPVYSETHVHYFFIFPFYAYCSPLCCSLDSSLSLYNSKYWYYSSQDFRYYCNSNSGRRSSSDSSDSSDSSGSSDSSSTNRIEHYYASCTCSCTSTSTCSCTSTCTSTCSCTKSLRIRKIKDLSCF